MSKLVCNYCKGAIEDKSYSAGGYKYHLKCLRIFRKEIDKQKQLGKIREGKENDVQVGNSTKFINPKDL